MMTSDCDINLQQQFVAEIDYKEIEIKEFVGKGSYGVVKKGKWKNCFVAVKYIYTETERKAFAVELRQLSRVSHPNIVKLYGACTKNPVCLIMEYAEGGSLFNVLHGKDPLLHYSAAHAMSWALQCAQGVAYLHNMKPKPLIHRDLKPPNLLLIFGGQTLKICDFGTACDLETYMTNSKGSAPWMAPEVFEGCNYTEKCDIFSWGTILWEIISRKLPFHEGFNACRILWAIHMGRRLPLIENCPKPIETLMIRCWDHNPEIRPSMNEVVQIMSRITEFFPEHLEPIDYSPNVDNNYHDMNTNTLGRVHDNTVEDSSCKNGFKELHRTLDNHSENQHNISESNNKLLSSNFDAFDTKNIKGSKEFSQNMKTQGQKMTTLYVNCDPNSWELINWDKSYMTDSMIKPVEMENQNFNSNNDLDNVHQLLDIELQPLTPDYTCSQSVKIFEEHKQLAQEYLKVQTELALLDQNKKQMTTNLDTGSCNQKEIAELNDEKEALEVLYRNMKKQLELIQKRRKNVGNKLILNQTIEHEL